MQQEKTARPWKQREAISQYSEIYSQWLPKMQLLLLMIAVGGIGTLVCLVLFTLQAGRNGKNKEIRLYFFDQWYTEIAAAAAILIVMGAVGIVPTAAFIISRILTETTSTADPMEMKQIHGEAWWPHRASSPDF